MIDYKTARKSMERRPYSLQGLRTSRENLTPAVHAFKQLILRKKIDRLPFLSPEPVLSWPSGSGDENDRLQSNITTAIARILDSIKK